MRQDLHQAFKRSVFKACQAQACRIHLETDGASPATGVVRSTTDDEIEIELVEGSLEGGHGAVSFELHGVPFAFGAEFSACGKVVTTRMPATIAARTQRRGARVPVEAGTAFLVVDRVSSALRAVKDLSPSGVRIANSNGIALHGPCEAELVFGKRRIPCIAQPRHWYTSDGDCGIELQGDEEAARALARLYHRVRYPRLIPRADARPEDVAGLMARSAYVDLRDGAPMDSVWTAAKWDDALSSDVVFPDKNGVPIGHISVTRAYERTWMAHQLATLATRREGIECLRDLYSHGANWAQLNCPDANQMSYFNPQLPWHLRHFETFVEWLDRPEQAVMFHRDRFEPIPESEKETNDASALPAASALSAFVEVRRMRAGEELAVLRCIERSLPALAVDGYDLKPGKLDGELFQDPAGHAKRRREALVLFEDGKFVGTAICEFGNPALSLFNIFNFAQLFFEADGGGPSAMAQAALAKAARAPYHERMLGEPIIVAAPGEFRGASDAGLRFHERMGCIVWNAEGLRQYDSFLRVQFGTRKVRTQPRSGQNSLPVNNEGAQS
ncbi:MAG: hypothetical protein R3A78_16365 [Polyangiales bacterium]|nr:hypothetical protein [Myxococcales bacterium]